MQIASDAFDHAHGGKEAPLGLPASISVALFDLDGVLTSTAVLHQKAWKQAFDSDPVGRQQGGVRRYRVLRPTDDPNHVLVDLEFDGSSEAEAFRSNLRELWSRVEGDLGLESHQARIFEDVETKEY